MPDSPHGYSAAYKKGMVINEINNILLRDAAIITLSLGEQTIFQKILWEGRPGNLGSELVFIAFLMFYLVIHFPCLQPSYLSHIDGQLP